MTAVAGHVTAGRPAPALPPGGRARARRRCPGWSPGIELLGELKDSGFGGAAVTDPARRRAGDPDVAAAVPGGLPDRRRPRPPAIAGAGQRQPGPGADRRAGPATPSPPS